MIRCILNKATDPAFNLALEEALLTKTEGSFFLLQKNAPCLIIGKHQNIFREIHLREVALNHLPVLRRISGGGTVYHDLGNLNFSFITGANPNWVGSNTLLQPIIEALKKLGIEVNFLGKTHLGVEDRKISGNAQAMVKKRMLHHGTLLYQADLQRLKRYLQLPGGIFEDRAVNSEPRPVANISSLTDATLEEVEMELALTVSGWWEKTQSEQAPEQREGKAWWGNHESPPFHTILLKEQRCWSSILGEDLWEEIQRLAIEKYRSWEWNYGYPMGMTYTNTRAFLGQRLTMEAVVENGYFQEVNWFFKKEEKRSFAQRKQLKAEVSCYEGPCIKTFDGEERAESIDEAAVERIMTHWRELLKGQPWDYGLLSHCCQEEPWGNELLDFLF